MNPNRETKTIKTLLGKDLVVYSYATGGEARQLEQHYLKIAKVELDSASVPSFKDVDPSVLFDVEKEMLRLLVVSYDGKTDSVVETLLDLPQDEYECIVKEVNALIKKKS